ncbi:MAG: hypothetical protein QXL20_00010 [Candidatus Bathyarchaeia archaeon]
MIDELHICAVCGAPLFESYDGEFKRYYCGKCDIPYYVYSPNSIDSSHRRKIGGLGALEFVDETVEEYPSKAAIALSLILIALLELVYHLFF